MGGQELEKLRASGIIRKRKRRGDLPEDDTVPTGDRTY
jgi:hypothetical protein